MSLLPEIPESIPVVKANSENIKQQNLQLVQQIARQTEQNIRECWHNPAYNPQDFLDTLGSMGTYSMQMNTALVTVVKTYEAVTGIKIFDDSVLALVGDYIVNNDGTITVKYD